MSINKLPEEADWQITKKVQVLTEEMSSLVFPCGTTETVILSLGDFQAKEKELWANWIA